LRVDVDEFGRAVPAAMQQLRQDSLYGHEEVVSEPSKKPFARRSQIEIRMDMLAAVKQGAEKPTQIMYRANLSWIALQTHLTQLLERGLLRWAADGNRKKYELTVKGANVVYAYVKILEEVGEDTSNFLEAGP